MDFPDYFKLHDGCYLAFKAKTNVLVILNYQLKKTKELRISKSVEKRNFDYLELFRKFKNKHNQEVCFSVMLNGHDGYDWLYYPEGFALYCRVIEKIFIYKSRIHYYHRVNNRGKII